jgi:branched-chain amino acid transport system permease protein
MISPDKHKTSASGFSTLSLLAALVVIAGLGIIPIVIRNTYALHIMILIFLSILLGSSWNILGGYTGQYSVGHAAYYGIGAYTTLILMEYHHVPPWYGAWAGMAAAIILALIIGTTCFRLRGPYFVLASIAVTEILRFTALNLTGLTNGAEGILATEIPPLTVHGRVMTDFLTKVPFYYAGLALVIAVIAATRLVERSKLGYYFQAIREDQDASRSLGINLTFYKNTALVISALFTALGGSLYAVYVGFIDPPTVMGLDISVQIVLICIIGGVGTLFGPVIGAVVLIPLSEALRSNFIAEELVNWGLVRADSKIGRFLTENLGHAHVLIYGILVVLVILFMPEGILGFLRKLAARKRKAGA